MKNIVYSCLLLLSIQLTSLVQAASLPLQQIRLPEGFRITVFAEQVPNARSMAMSPNGTLFVGTRRAGKVYAIKDYDRDNNADEIITLAKDLYMPNGVVFHEADLYVAEGNRLLRFPEIEQNLKNPETPEIVNDSFPKEQMHGWKFIRLGPDGKLYVPIGAPCNICKSQDERFATITRMDLDGSKADIFAKGVRNSVGFDWHPETKELWFTDNGRDWLGDDRPPDELNHAPIAGLHFGYPYYHGKNIRDPEFDKKAGTLKWTAPAQELGPHVAALGMRFYTGSMFPARYKNQIFIAEHGSWNRSVPIGYRIMLVRLQDNVPVSYEVFAEGWLQKSGAWGRPVDLEVMADGSLLVSDDLSGTIYRIVYEQ
ncbi:MAG: sorbosone dehydrogenase family protein [bacterium]|nr:sorbosone dehydrogenase family protein [bacterium]